MHFSTFHKGSKISNEFTNQCISQNKVCLILHGLFGRKKNWESIGKNLSLNLPYCFITLDLRNHGDNLPSKFLTYEFMVDDLSRFCNRLGKKQISLIGHSMGGKVAMLFSLKFPDIVKNLVVVDIAPVKYTSDEEELIDQLLNLDLKKVNSRKDADDALKKSIGNDNLRKFLLQNLIRSSNGYMWSLNLNTIKNNLQHLRDFSIDNFNLFEKSFMYLW